MGICMDTGAKPLSTTSSNASTLEAHWTSAGEGAKTMAATDVIDHDVTNAFIIFVLGGPGSGKMTHSSSVVSDRNGNLVHLGVVEMTTSSSSMLSTFTASSLADLIVRRMSESPSAPGFLISGYPRHPADIDEWMERVGRVDGVILLEWPFDSLELQVAEGVRQGKVGREEGLDELRLFVRHSSDVADFFDHRGLLYTIKGEREPEEVYPDLLDAFDNILVAPNRLMKRRPKTAGSFREYRSRNNDDLNSTQELQRVIQEDDETKDDANEDVHQPTQDINNNNNNNNNDLMAHKDLMSDVSKDNVDDENLLGSHGLPRVIWVIGGPGSSKLARVQRLVSNYQGWKVVGVGQLLRQLIHQPDADKEDVGRVKDTAYVGDLVPDNIVVRELVKALEGQGGSEGVFVTGFPRTLAQMEHFQRKTSVRPSCVLIDCSELELSANLARRKERPDDNLTAYKRRLELYRKATLPMLRTLDDQNRLRIVDGDSEADSVHLELGRCLQREVAAFDNDEEKKRKLLVRRYEGLDPQVEEELQKVIDELQEKGTENITIKTLM